MMPLANGSAEKPESLPLQSEPTSKIDFSFGSSSKLAAAENPKSSKSAFEEFEDAVTTNKHKSEVFDRMPQRDVVSWNAMIFCYANIGFMDMAQSIFDEIPEKDVISWNSLISGYQQGGSFQTSAEIFLKMRQADIRPDHTTLAVALKSCSALNDYKFGSQIHGLAVKIGLDVDVVECFS